MKVFENILPTRGLLRCLPEHFTHLCIFDEVDEREEKSSEFSDAREAFLLLADFDLCFLLVVEARGGGVMTPLLPLLWLPLLLFLLELTRELERLFEVTAEEEEPPLEPFRLGANELDDVVGGFIIDLDLKGDKQECF